MSDVYELLLALDLRGDVGDDELAELRWQVGGGPRPDRRPIGTGAVVQTWPLGDPQDPNCTWETAEPEPVLAEHGPASVVGGALVAELVRREDVDGWALTVRQELHPDSFPDVQALLSWLGPHSIRATDAGEFHAGHLRFHEEVEVEPLILRNGVIDVPAAVSDW